MEFAEIQSRLLARVRLLVHNGELTERGFARFSGISQPHIHKVLKGTRTLSTSRFDLLLRALSCSVLDLFQEEELRNHLSFHAYLDQPHTELPLHQNPLGPGAHWSPEQVSHDCLPVPCSLLTGNGPLVLTRLNPDPSMRVTLGNHNIAVLELTKHLSADPNQLYAVDRRQETVLRRIRRGCNRFYLISDQNPNDPLHWETVATLDRGGRSSLRGRLVWLSGEKRRKPPHSESGHALDATSSYVSRT